MHGITPKTIEKAIKAGIEEEILARRIELEASGQSTEEGATQEYLNALEAEMQSAAADLDFERAAKLRDRILELKGEQPMTASPKRRGRKKGRSGQSTIPRPKRAGN